MSDEPAAWPDDDEDPFGDNTEKLEGSLDDQEQEILKDSEEELSDEEPNPEDAPQGPDQWTLPIRVSPILALSGEEVKEYPLNESLDGKKNTSLIISDNLIRIIEATYDDDGQRRLNIKMVLKNELTGFSHNHNELMHKHQWMWILSFIAGFITIFIPYLGFLGQVLVAVGLIGWTYMHLELHTLEFSTSGSKHKVHFTGYGSYRPMFRASMALIGPTIAKYMDSGDFDTESITMLHDSLAKPPEPVVEHQIPPITMMDEGPMQQFQSNLQPLPPENIPASVPEPVEVPAPPPDPPAPSELTKQTGPPVSLPPPPAPTNPIPPPPSPSLPPATLPPPLPPGGMLPPPMPMGMDLGEPSLDAPLPEAPEIAVPAAPVEESLSDDEKNELLEELK